LNYTWESSTNSSSRSAFLSQNEFSQLLQEDVTPEKSCLIPGLTLYLPSHEETDWNSISIIAESCQRCHIFWEIVSDECVEVSKEMYQFSSFLYITSIEISKGKGMSKRDAKHDAAKNGIKKLMDKQPIIYKSDINHDHLSTIEKGQLVRRSYETAPKLDDSNLGNKLLRKMGWKGSGGIGKHEKGIADPVFVDAVEGRKGVGHEQKNTSIKRDSVEKTLLDFIRDDQQTEIRFSNDLSSEERAIVHMRCQKFGLRHKSHGKGDDRYLVVSKKK